MSLVSPYLVFLTIVCVVLPSVAAICLRFALYKELVVQAEKIRRLVNRKARGDQPELVKELESRFKQASLDLEQVNTAALIDQIYGRGEFKYFGWRFRYEQVDYFCRILPNLLLAFGLFGTFLGITLSLFAISRELNASIDSSGLRTALQQPLQGMAIAFIASLTGLLFSVVLTVINFSRNTSLAKYQLISLLEDYLDNVYQPTLEGHTRLDKVVDRMASLFQGFLTNFGQTVREAVESSLQAKIQEIFDANIKATQLAEQVYSRFLEASGTIARSADDLRIVADHFIEAAQTFERSQFPQRLQGATDDLADTQQNFSQSAITLSETVHSIKTAVEELQSSSQKLLDLGENTNNLILTSGQVLESTQSNQQSLSEIIPQLQQGGQSFQSAIKTLDKLQKRVVTRVDSLDDVQAELTKLVQVLKNYTDRVNEGVQSLGDRFTTIIFEQVGSNNQQVRTLIENVAGSSSQLTSKLDCIKVDLVEVIKDYQSDVKHLGNRFVEVTNNQASNNHSQVIAEKLQLCIDHLNDTKHEVCGLRRTLEDDLKKDKLPSNGLQA